MVRRVFASILLALCLVLTSLAAVVAETRMAAAGGYCGTGTPQILLDRAGLPVLDAEGAAVAAPDCSLCHLAFALAVNPHTPNHATSVLRAPVHVAAADLPHLSHGSTRHARAPPRLA